MSLWTSLLADNESWQSVKQSLEEQTGNLLVSGVGGSVKSLLAAAIACEGCLPLLYIAASGSQADQVARDLQAFLPHTPVLTFPARENPLYGVAAQSPETAAERLQVLQRLQQGERLLLVASWDALTYRLPHPDILTQHSIQLAYGQEIPMEQVIRLLVQAGYERVEMVESPGQFSQRGGILDVYGLTDEWPVRIEWFGDEIDLIRQFDLTTQRSLGNIDSVSILPAQESIWPQQAKAEGLRRMAAALQRAERQNPSLAAELQRYIAADLARLEADLVFPGRERYLPFFLEHRFSLLDYLPEQTLVVVDEPTRIWEQAEADYSTFNEGVASLLAEGRLLPQQAEMAFSPYELVAQLPAGRTLFLALFPRRPAPWRVERHTAFLSRSIPNFQGQMAYFKQEVERLLQNNYRVLIMAADPKRQEEIKRYLQDEGLQNISILAADQLPQNNTIGVILGDLSAGLEIPESRLYLLTEGDILRRKRPQKRSRLSRAEGARLADYRDLAVGDYVVHVQHGIGRYLGIKTLEIAGLHRDYLHVKYAGEDSLYVPTDQVHLLQKYVGSEGKVPKIYSLGGGDWQKVKARVKQSVQEMAGQLLKLYAARETAPGFAFAPDGEWQEQMEHNFPYQETPDQAQAILEIKRDLESPKPMDRLLCGDVGYGKTEVAVRAAFKVATAGKQVAVLVPTTILAQQHYNTFRERFSGFPLELALLSRFRSNSENAATVKRLQQGLVDVVIGTHRLLQKDVQFRDLGLLIIDEEQRFGVAHKERLKELKQSVDTLTLTATPIPRTLHMAMVGMRDMSVIETPPEDRFPVQTYVMEYNPELVQSVIRKELARGGQVYYVHNRVRSIRSVVERLAQLVPEARICYGHGRMGEERLERLMLDFIEGEYDILVSTTIIESGLDIPNVNTLILEDADKFGLAQLYQLRGRVGRSNRVAYAYFTYRPDKALSEVADKRLQAIKEFTELGSGFKIAMRDLEIRGAGNILGPEQHGFMVAVGFDLYCQLLEEAVRELKGQPPRQEFEVELTLPFDAYIPERYIRDSRQKIEMYKKIRAAAELADVADLEDELLDRYGRLPEAVQNLLLVSRLRVLCMQLFISQLSINDQDLTLRLAPQTPIGVEQVALLYQRTNGRLRAQPRKPGVLTQPLAGQEPLVAAKSLLPLLVELAETQAEAGRPKN
jgi:transcription-repair coupling factor (superfamily II helicase)